MAEENQDTDDSKPLGGFVEKRKSRRYHVPAVYRRHVKLRVRSGDASVAVDIGNFSRSGILFFSSEPYDVEAPIACAISMSQWLAKDVLFGARVKYCVEKDSVYLIGANVESVDDALWFEVFVEVHDFVVRQQQKSSS
jgi:hypothetical protein